MKLLPLPLPQPDDSPGRCRDQEEGVIVVSLYFMVGVLADGRDQAVVGAEEGAGQGTEGAALEARHLKEERLNILLTFTD